MFCLAHTDHAVNQQHLSLWVSPLGIRLYSSLAETQAHNACHNVKNCICQETMSLIEIRPSRVGMCILDSPYEGLPGVAISDMKLTNEGR